MKMWEGFPDLNRKPRIGIDVDTRTLSQICDDHVQNFVGLSDRPAIGIALRTFLTQCLDSVIAREHEEALENIALSALTNLATSNRELCRVYESRETEGDNGPDEIS